MFQTYKTRTLICHVGTLPGELQHPVEDAVGFPVRLRLVQDFVVVAAAVVVGDCIAVVVVYVAVVDSNSFAWHSAAVLVRWLC